MNLNKIFKWLCVGGLIATPTIGKAAGVVIPPKIVNVSSLPATCTVGGPLYQKTSVTVGLYECTATNTLTLVGGISQTTADARYIQSNGATATTASIPLTKGVTIGSVADQGLIRIYDASFVPMFWRVTASPSLINRTLLLNFSAWTSGHTVTFDDVDGTVTQLGNSTTGSGNIVQATSPVIVTPTIASFVNATHNHTNAAGGGTLTPSSFGGFRLRVSTQFDKTTTTLGAVTGLTAPLAATTTYEFEVVLHVSADAVGGHKYSIDTSDTLTATAIIYQVNSINNGTNAFRINSRQTALGGAVGEAVGTAYFTIIKGTITTNAAGTFEIRFAQNSANGTSSVLVGSTCNIWPVA